MTQSMSQSVSAETGPANVWGKLRLIQKQADSLERCGHTQFTDTWTMPGRCSSPCPPQQGLETHRGEWCREIDHCAEPLRIIQSPAQISQLHTARIQPITFPSNLLCFLFQGLMATSTWLCRLVKLAVVLACRRHSIHIFFYSLIYLPIQ